VSTTPNTLANLSPQQPSLQTPISGTNGALTPGWMMFFALLGQLSKKLLLQPRTFDKLPLPSKPPVLGAGGQQTDLDATWGSIAVVTDSTVNTWGSVIAGGGGNVVLAFNDGTNWTVIGQ
jgi:hypothetical protein